MSAAELAAARALPQASTVTPKSMIAVGVCLPVLAALSVALRFYVRLARKVTLGLDDLLILFAQVLTLGLGIMLIVGSAQHALAQPTPLGEGPLGFMFVKNKALVTTEKMKWAFNLLLVLVLGAVKLSVVFFYRRVFRGSHFDRYSKFMIGLITVWTLSFFFTVLFECRTNFKYLWSTLHDLLTHCSNDVEFQKAMAISDVITDVLIIVMPLPVVLRLQMSGSTKIALCGVFLLGLVALAASLARVIIFYIQLGNAFSVSQGILLISTSMYWGMIEMGLSIIAACLPTLRPLIGDPGVQTMYENARSYIRPRSKDSSSDHRDSADVFIKLNPRRMTPPNHTVTTSIYPTADTASQTSAPEHMIAVQEKIEQNYQMV